MTTLPSILGLFSGRSPSAIPWLVVAVIVGPAIQAFSMWAWPHVGKKVREAFTPTLADLDATTTIPLPVLTAWIRTALNHGTPYRIFRNAPSKHTSFAMLSITFARLPRFFQASTATHMAVPQVSARDNCFIAFDAATKPTHVAFCFNTSNNEKPSETLACTIYEGGHNQRVYQRA